MPLTYTVTTSEYQFNVLHIKYNNYETIEIDISDFYKDQSDIFSLYDQINDYLATLPEYTQKEIYDIFYSVYLQEYKQNYSDPSCVSDLENKVAKVCSLLNYNNFKMWMLYRKQKVFIPEDVPDEYIHDQDMNITKEKTYTKDDYYSLICLITFIRALSPLYLDFYAYIKQVTSHYYYKIFMLFICSEIYTCPEVEKLRSYIEANQITLIGNTKNEHLIINAGLSDDDILDSLVSEVIFNKLIYIDFFSRKCNIVSFIFQTIKYKGNFNASDSSAIRSKTTAANGDVNKEDISYFEDYRKTTNIPIGTVVEIQHALSNTEFLVNALGHSNFDYNLYREELKYVPVFLEKKLDKIQIYLLGWFMNKIINPRALYYIEYRRLVELMLFAKTVLMLNGQDFVAVLLSSYRSQETSFINFLVRNSVNKALIKNLSTYYSFSVEDGRTSVIERTINEISKEITNCLWVPVGRGEYVSKFVNKHNYLIIPNNINDIICSYVEFVEKS